MADQMAVQTRSMTVEEFEQFVDRPENADRLFEYIGGEIVQMVSNNYASLVAAAILAQLFVYAQSSRLGYVTGADGGYRILGERYVPDAAFVSKTRQPAPSHEAYNPIAPDLAVEVLSPGNDPRALRLKITNYLAAGTTVWLVDPERREVEVHAPGQAAQRLGASATLDGGAVLPGFTLTIKDIFPE